MSATTTAAPDAPQHALTQRRFLGGGGMGLLPLREGDDGPISSMPSSSELCTGLYCTMWPDNAAAAVFNGRSWLFSTAAVAPAQWVSGDGLGNEGYGCSEGAATGSLLILDHKGDTSTRQLCSQREKLLRRLKLAR